MQIEELLGKIFSSPFVDDTLCTSNLGSGKSSRHAAAAYLGLPPLSRPKVSYLFDKEFYLDANSDVANAAEDPLVHFINHGCNENRPPNTLTDFNYIRSIDPTLLSARPSHLELWGVLNCNLVNPGPYFENVFYQTQLEGYAAPASGLLEHFFREGLLAGLKPNPMLEPLWYYRQLEGAHDVHSGLRHFVKMGDKEGLAPSPRFSGRRYLERYQDVAAAGVPALAHYLMAGLREGRAYFAEKQEALRHPCPEVGAPEIFSEEESIERYERLKTRVLERRGRQKDSVSVSPIQICRHPGEAISSIRFRRFAKPKVSILIPAYNEFSYTVECLASIAKSTPKIGYEVVLADDASPDPEMSRLAKVRNIVYVRQPANIGFLKNCNAAFSKCRGEYVLLLNNDAQVMPGSIDALVSVLDTEPDVAAVGPKILYPDGRLQEAGCTIDRNGISSMVGLFTDPQSPSFMYTRDVHYCSGAALLFRREQVEGQLFDEEFTPAYCEDADLCLRFLARGKRVVYCSRAEVVHHLSVSTNKHSVTERLQLVTRNQQRLVEKWAPLLEEMNRVRPIAFYLPQYYPTPENDLVWGRGFTEWTNVSKATPAYDGHYQPHLPSDMGFYDLRVKEIMSQQTILARRYGIAGFCVYYYNFGHGRRVLDKAFEAMVSDRQIDFPYCACWANENWTRHWDGGSKDLIFEQQYDEKTLQHVISDAVRYASDPRYITVNKKPLFLVYRPVAIPDPHRFTELCRAKFREQGFDGVYLVYVESMETAEKAVIPRDLGFDACVEFPPQGLAARAAFQDKEVIKDGFIGVRYDYEDTVLESIFRPPTAYKRYPSVFPSWDNTPRQPVRGDSFIRATPEAFQIYLEEKLDEATKFLVGEERLLFINAWNEWAEGAHLEPDRRFGHRWLEAVRNALLAKSLV
ncbi:MAG: glycoside hydrolase family 99-like domain-containing protein [Rhodospirillales bacterium]|nr:glycoside hydrolase family 99-like domain-containing protein [Rhodospirillales bacterium]